MYRVTIGAAVFCALLAAPFAACGDEPSVDDLAWQAYQRGEYALALQLHERIYAETRQPERLAAIGQAKIKLGRVRDGLKDCLAYFNYVPNPLPPQRAAAESCIAEGRQALAPATPGAAPAKPSVAELSLPLPVQMEDYERRAIRFEYNIDIHSPTFKGWAQVSPRWIVSRTGLPPQELSWPAFYELTGRNDLAASYRSRRSAKIGLYVTGALLVAGGAISVLSGLVTSGDSRTPLQAAGGVLIGLGGIELIVGQIVAKQPVTSGEARHLADLYNQRLRQETVR